MVELIGQFGIVQVLLILLIGIPAIVNFIAWCKKLWSKREEFKNENIEKGKRIEARAEEKEARFSNGEQRMDLLEDNVKELRKIAENQERLINLLIQSDQLDIKSWLKAQHERWMDLGCIDNQMLDLVTQRFSIYEKEGGNSWAKRLTDDMRSLPVVTWHPDQRVKKD